MYCCDVRFASGCSVGTAVPTENLPPEANHLQNICTVDVASGGRYAVDVLQLLSLVAISVLLMLGLLLGANML